MCGLVGVYHFGGAPVDRDVLRAMREIQRHRGPDDHGARLFSLRDCSSAECPDGGPPPDGGPFEGGVAFNRLSILDLSAEGHQPMSSADGQVFIAYNGEAYNAFDYTDELTAAGFHFHSRSDTEVLLYLYQHHGFEGMLSRINGMFAICIVDLREQAIFLARDRLGIKPLYWYRRGDAFLFGSEIKSFLPHPDFVPALEHDVLDEHFAFRFAAGGHSLFRDLHELSPGHWMRVTPTGTHVSTYWSLPEGGDEDGSSFDESIETIEIELRRSVQARLLSDVTVGCQLSGGVDSSLVDLFASQSAGSQLDAYSVVFDDPRFTEEPWIDEAASKSGVDVHKATMNAAYFAGQFQHAAWFMDQPLNLPNSLGIYRIAQMAKPQVTVLLSGEGADEALGGYPRFFYGLARHQLRWLLPLAARTPGLRRRFGNLRGTGYGASDDVSRFITSSAFIELPALRELRPDASFDSVAGRRRMLFGDGSGDYRRDLLNYELRTYLVDLLMRQDRMTMAHAVENRVPFLDHRLIERVATLPTDHLIRTPLDPRRLRQRDQVVMRGTKVALKALAARLFGERFAYRPKQGFDLPLVEYFAHPPFRALVEDHLLPGMRDRGVIRFDAAERWWRDAMRGDQSNGDPLWVLVAFEQWAQLFLDGGWRELRDSLPSPA
jgi:asparagine synthase (glutamine-hydrolysing)